MGSNTEIMESDYISMLWITAVLDVVLNERNL